METITRGNTPSNSGMPASADGALSKASSSAHAAVDAMAGAADQAARKAKPAIDKVTAIAHQAVDKAAGAAVPAADWLAEKSESLDATQKKLIADTCAYVSVNPLKLCDTGCNVYRNFLSTSGPRGRNARHQSLHRSWHPSASTCAP